jgi:hypothetical protein
MSSQVQRVLYPNGQLKAEAPMVNGRIHGLKRDYHPNGQLALEIPFYHGLPNGTAKVWAADGRSLGDYTMEHGTGVMKLWHSNGVPASEVSMVEGLITGRQKIWYEDGKALPETYWIRGRKATRKNYLEACKTDPDLPRYEEGEKPALKEPSGKYRRSKHAIPELQRDLHDKKIAEFRAKPNQREAREWLATTPVGKTRWLGEMTSEDSVEIVRKGYAAGAENITAVDVQTDEDGNQTTNYLIVRVPSEGSKRRRVFKWSNELAEESGIDGDEDWGQSELFIFFD